MMIYDPREKENYFLLMHILTIPELLVDYGSYISIALIFRNEKLISSSILALYSLDINCIFLKVLL